MKSPQTAIAKWSKNGGQSDQAWVDGINSVTENPMHKAANRADAALAGFSDAITSGRWARKLQSLPTSAWSGPSVAKRGNYKAGFQGPGLTKYTNFYNAIAPVYASSSLAAKAAKQQGVGATQRMIANANAMRTFAGKGPID